MAEKKQALSIRQSLDLALKHHISGRLSEAERVYQKILDTEPAQPSAMHLLGVIKHQTGDNNTAVKLITKALNIDPNNADAHCNLGLAFKELGKLNEAVKSYHKALSLVHDHTDTLNNLGLALHTLGRPDDAATSYQKVLTINPNHAKAHNNLGLALGELGKPTDAVNSYRRAIAVQPDYADAYVNLGSALQALGKPEEAVTAYRKALAFNPKYAEAQNNLGLALHEIGNFEEAAINLQSALLIKPDMPEAYNNLGNTLRALGKPNEAISNYRKALTVKPDYAEAQHMLDALTGNTTATPPRKYVENLFNGYAERFDQSLVRQLGYNLPAIVKKFTVELGYAASNFDEAIDLGCGTGLSGLEFRDVCETLTGVDISKNMITKARNRKIYDRLIVGDIVDSLNSSREKYDLFICLDVLIYVGALPNIFSAVKERSHTNALFIFSIESQAVGEYTLLETGRYSHSDNYVLKTSSDQFRVLHSQEVNLRRKAKGWVHGKVFMLQVC